LRAAEMAGLRLVGKVGGKVFDNAEHSKTLEGRAAEWVGLKTYIAMAFRLTEILGFNHTKNSARNLARNRFCGNLQHLSPPSFSTLQGLRAQDRN
jgi:hypothetical protein